MTLLDPVNCPKHGEQDVVAIYPPKPGRSYSLMKLSCGHTAMFVDSLPDLLNDVRKKQEEERKDEDAG